LQGCISGAVRLQARYSLRLPCWAARNSHPAYPDMDSSCALKRQQESQNWSRAQELKGEAPAILLPVLITHYSLLINPAISVDEYLSYAKIRGFPWQHLTLTLRAVFFPFWTKLLYFCLHLTNTKRYLLKNFNSSSYIIDLPFKITNNENFKENTFSVASSV
jgi:hypothetical protein